MSKFFQNIILPIIVVALFNSCMTDPDIHPNTNRGNFEALWEIVDKRYCYLDYKEIDWNEVYSRYSERIDTVSNKYSLFDLLAKMLSELKDGHVNLYSEFDISRYTEWYSSYPSNFNSKILYSERYLGKNFRIAGSMRYRPIANNQIGYIYYGSFSSKFSEAHLRSIFEAFKSCKALIIDVRNNGGGLLTSAELLASCFFTEKTLTGYISHKIGDGHSDFSKPVPIYTEPHKKIKWERPVVILTNRHSYSATNDFVCKMKYAPSATIVGDKTGGGGGLPLSSELPNGWMVRFSASPAFDAEMANTEWGIEPDVKVDMLDTDEANGFDTIIETAIALLLSN